MKRTPQTIQKTALALQLRSQGLTYEEIAARVGYTHKSAARRAVQKAMQGVIIENVSELRRIEGEALDMLERECWKRLESSDHAGAMLFAVDRILAIHDKRAKLFGLYAKPEELEHNAQPYKTIIITHEDGTQTDARELV